MGLVRSRDETRSACGRVEVRVWVGVWSSDGSGGGTRTPGETLVRCTRHVRPSAAKTGPRFGFGFG